VKKLSETEPENKKIETVEVTLNVPKGILQFLKDIIPSTNYDSVQEYLEDCIVSRIEGDVDADIFSPKIKQMVKRYNLKGVFSS